MIVVKRGSRVGHKTAWRVFKFKKLANKSLVGDPKSGTFSCVSPCVGESVFIVWSGAGRHNSTVILLS